MSKRFKVLVCVVLIVAFTLALSLVACDKPAGGGGLNPDNNKTPESSGEITVTADKDLEGFMADNAAVFETLKSEKGITQDIIVISANSLENIDTYFNQVLVPDEKLSKDELAIFNDEKAKHVDNVKKVIVKRELQCFAFKDAAGKITIDKGMVYAPVNVFESYCEFNLALDGPEYLDSYDSSLNQMKNSLKKKVQIDRSYAIQAGGSQLVSDEYDAYRILDKVTVEGDFAYLKGSTTLIKYLGNAAEVVIPDKVTEISANVFRANKNITSITINDNVQMLGENCFANIPELVLHMESVTEENPIHIYASSNGNGNKNMLKKACNEYSTQVYYQQNEIIPQEPVNLFNARPFWLDDEISSLDPRITRKEYLTKLYEDKGYSNIKLSIASLPKSTWDEEPANTYFVEEFIKEKADKENWSEAEIEAKITNIISSMKENQIHMIVVIADGKPIDLISSLIESRMEGHEMTDRERVEESHKLAVVFDSLINNKSNEAPDTTIEKDKVYNLKSDTYNPLTYYINSDSMLTKENIFTFTNNRFNQTFEGYRYNKLYMDEQGNEYLREYGIVENYNPKEEYDTAVYGIDEVPWESTFKKDLFSNAKYIKEINFDGKIPTLEKGWIPGNNAIYITTFNNSPDKYDFSNEVLDNGNYYVEVTYNYNVMVGEQSEYKQEVQYYLHGKLVSEFSIANENVNSAFEAAKGEHTIVSISKIRDKKYITERYNSEDLLGISIDAQIVNIRLTSGKDIKVYYAPNANKNNKDLEKFIIQSDSVSLNSDIYNPNYSSTLNQATLERIKSWQYKDFFIRDFENLGEENQNSVKVMLDAVLEALAKTL